MHASSLWILVALLAAGVLLPPSVQGQRLCFPQYQGVPYTYKPPAVDGTFVTTFAGNVDRDTGWTGAFRYVLWNGTPDADGAVQALQDHNNHLIYFSFQMKNDPTFDSEDSIIIAFDPDRNGTGTNMQRIIIHPVVGGAGATDPQGKLLAGAIEYAKGYDPNQGGWPTTVTDPPFITAVARSAGTPPNPLSWDVEVKIDSGVNGLNLPNADFGLYIDMVRVQSNDNSDTQFTWPSSTPLKIPIQGQEILLEGDSLPSTNSWSVANLGVTKCTGVYVGPSDIASNHNGVISLNQPNQFSVALHNNGALAAQQVSARVEIANYGLPAPQDWVRPGEAFNNLIGGDPIGPVTVNADTQQNPNLPVSTGLWTIPANGAEHDYYAANPDMCVRVSLDSAVPDTIFGAQSARLNFWVRNTSEFVNNVTVGTKGYRLRPGQERHEFDLSVTRNVKLARTREQLSQMDYVVHGCRYTGVFLVINKKKFKDCQSVGAFGYRLVHRGPIKGFQDELSAGNLLAPRPERKDSFHLVLPPGQDKIQLRTRVVSVEDQPNPPQPKPPCGTAAGKSTGAILLLGLVMLGFVSYRPRKNNH